MRRLQNRLYEPALNLISQRLSGFECVGDSLLRFALSAQANESFALQIENVLLGNGLRRRNAATRQYVCQFSCDNRVVLTGEFAPNKHMDCEFRSGQKFLPQDADFGGRRRVISLSDKRQRRGFRIRYLPMTEADAVAAPPVSLPSVVTIIRGPI